MIILGVASGIEGNIGSGRLSFVLRQGLAMQLSLGLNLMAILPQSLKC